jgi:hypothetical protein
MLRKFREIKLTFCLSLIMVQGPVLTMPRFVRNQLHVKVSSTSTTAKANGNIQSFGSIPTDVSNWPLYFVLMWQPSRHITELQAARKPLLQASKPK